MKIFASPTGFIFNLRNLPARAGYHSPVRQRCGSFSLSDCIQSVSETTAYGADRIMFASGILDNFTKTSDFHRECMFS